MNTKLLELAPQRKLDILDAGEHIEVPRLLPLVHIDEHLPLALRPVGRRQNMRPYDQTVGDLPLRQLIVRRLLRPQRRKVQQPCVLNLQTINLVMQVNDMPLGTDAYVIN